jgi:hypothetical protein
MEILANSCLDPYDPYSRSAGGCITLPNSNSYDLKLGVSVRIDAMDTICGPQRNDTCFTIWWNLSITTGDHTDIAVIDRRNECGIVGYALPLQLSQGEMIDRNLTWMYGEIPQSEWITMPDSTRFLPIRRFTNKGVLYG